DDMSVGLLGGSFNPAHEGHVQITMSARRLLGLKRCWWLVSPQNPLKDPAGYEPFVKRVHQARALNQGRRWLSVTTIEASLPSLYTVDTLHFLRCRFPKTRFVWLMGADSWVSFHRWHRWREIALLFPICVVSRPGYDMSALTSVAARTFADARRPTSSASVLAGQKAPAWVFLPTVHNPISATAIRAETEQAGNAL
ncbi:MAG: nicotinate-nucleotide adenylyltransferase, partial [Pseudomonadota bacterium]